MDFDLKNAVFEFVKTEMIDSVRNDKNVKEFFALITDDDTLTFISYCATTKTMNEAGIGVVLKISNRREMLNVPAIYFVYPTDDNINLIISDFTKNKSLYNKVHLFFNGHVTDQQLKKLKSCKNLISKLKTFKETDLTFITDEKRVFSFDCDGLMKIYSDDQEKINLIFTNTANRLTSLLIALKEFPHIRYIKSSASMKLFSSIIEKTLNKKIRKLPNWKYDENRSTLIVLDRGFEPIAPLLHEYTFKAMVSDLLELKNEIVKDDKNELMMLNDEIWEKYSYDHIANVVKGLTKESLDFRENNPILKVKRNENKKNIKDLSKALKNAPHFKKLADSYSKNISIAEKCMKIFKTDNLKEISSFEQDLATGLKENGEKANKKYFEKKMDMFIKDDKISREKKIRLLLIFKGITKKEPEIFFEWVKGVDLTRTQTAAIEKIEKLGKKIYKGKSYEKRNKKYIKETNLSLSRYVPQIHDIITDCCEGNLSNDDFPYLRELPPSNKEEEQSKRRAKNKKEKVLPKIILFVIGGASQSEIRSVYKLSKKYGRNIIIGCSSIINAKEYINILSLDP